MRKRGFTLIELLVVITIIVLLSSVAIVSFSSSSRNARDAKRKADAEQIRSALEIYRSENNAYPASIDFGGSITFGGNTYLDPVPVDPKDGQTGFGYTYVQNTSTSYELCVLTMEGTSESSPYCLKNP